MANYGPADIKALHKKTDADMMDVRKTLGETDGDTAKARELLRVKGLKAIVEREGRSAINGLTASTVYGAGRGKRGVFIEVSVKTDFVTRNKELIAMADEVLQAAVEAGISDVKSVLAAKLGKGATKNRVEGLIAVIGEKMEVPHIAVVGGEHVKAYMHRANSDLPPQVDVLVATDAAGASVAHDAAVHITALGPTYLDHESVPADVIGIEKRITTETTIAEGKPENAVPKVVQGRMNNFCKSVVPLGQGFARDPEVSVGRVVSGAGGKVTTFARLRVDASAE